MMKPLRDLSDEELALMVKPEKPENGDSAFEVLYNRYRSKVLSHVKFHLGRQYDTESVCQEVMIKLHGALKSRNFDPHRESLRTYIWGITANATTDELRKAAREVRRYGLLTDTIQTSEDQNQEESIGVVRKAVNSLDDRHRRIVELRLEDCDYAEIARIVGVTVGTARFRYFAAKKILADYIRAHYPSLDTTAHDRLSK